MSGNYERALDAIKSKNGGSVPSDLYFKTNSVELGLILYNLTGNIKHKFPSGTSKEIFMKIIQKITATTANSKLNLTNILTESLSNSIKRKLDSNNEKQGK